jgi:AcrR family transcriptional regulator
VAIAVPTPTDQREEPEAPVPGISIHRDRRYAGASRVERDAARRSRLLEAGLETFGTEGYAASTIEGLCARACVSTRHFYDHFHSRESLLVAVYDRIIGQLRHSVLEVLGTRDDLEEQMRAGISAYVVPLLADERLPRIVHLEVIGVSPELERHRRAMIHAFAGLVEAEATRLMDPAALRRLDVHLVSLGLVGATTELLVDWVVGTPRVPASHLVGELVHIFVGSLSRPVSAGRALDGHAPDFRRPDLGGVGLHHSGGAHEGAERPH